MRLSEPTQASFTQLCRFPAIENGSPRYAYVSGEILLSAIARTCGETPAMSTKPECQRCAAVDSFFEADKPAAFRVIDTHAGSGLYDLAGEKALRGGEWQDSIGKLMAAKIP